MFVRKPSDYRTILWVVIATALVAFQFLNPQYVRYLWWVSAYFALACGVIAHNHNHVPTFGPKWANNFFSNWISIFYGYPTFAWVPTHNLNHHRFVNKQGDATITWRYTNRHNAFVAFTYFFVSSYWQSGPIRDYIQYAKTKNRKLYRTILTQYFVWGGAHVALLATAVAMHGWKKGMYVWTLVCFIPAFFALWTIMLFNYEQHVHTDPWSKHNHSRSFVGKLTNFLLFNNGYHTVHHEHAGLHWSEAAEAHAKIAAEIDPRLVERSMLWYFFRQYVLAAFIPRLGSVQVGRAPFDETGTGEKVQPVAFFPLTVNSSE